MFALVVLTGLSGLVAIPQVAAGGCNSTTPWYSTSGDTTPCGFGCNSGDSIQVAGNADGAVWGAGDCGGAGGHGSCVGTGECVPDTVGVAGSADSDGSCYGNGDDAYISCASSDGANIDALNQLLAMILGGAGCDAIRGQAQAEGFTSIIVKHLDAGTSTTVFLYTRNGCVGGGGGGGGLSPTCNPALLDTWSNSVMFQAVIQCPEDVTIN